MIRLWGISLQYCVLNTTNLTTLFHFKSLSFFLCSFSLSLQHFVTVKLFWAKRQIRQHQTFNKNKYMCEGKQWSNVFFSYLRSYVVWTQTFRIIWYINLHRTQWTIFWYKILQHYNPKKNYLFHGWNDLKNLEYPTF